MKFKTNLYIILRNFKFCCLQKKNVYKVSVSFVEKRMKRKTEQNCEINFPFKERERERET